MEDESPTLRNIAKEVRADGYFERARQRARRRRSPWNLLLIPLGLGGAAASAYVLFRIMWRMHTVFHPEHAGRLREFWQAGIGLAAFVSSFLLLIPLLVAGVLLGLMLANCVAWCIPPARRTFEREAAGVKWASFRESMSGLGKIALLIVPICLLLSLVGALTLRSLR